MSPPHVAGAASEMPQVADLARPDQLAHRAPGVLHRHGAVHPVLVVQVDVVGAEPLQGRVTGLAHVLGPAVDGPAAVGQPLVAELGGQHDLVPRGP